jgi:hypothetical protein
VLVREILTRLDLGSSVAEHDAQLARYFVETETFRALVGNDADVIAGDKGTGKTALYRILIERYSKFPALRDVMVVPAFNPTGTPVFQRLDEGDILTEVDYIRIWKSYFLALAGNWMLNFAAGDWSPDLVRLNSILSDAGLRTEDDSAKGVFTRIIEKLKGVFSVKSAEATGTLTPDGMPVLSGKIEFGRTGGSDTNVAIDDSLRLLDTVLNHNDVTLWLALDRLDEAFQSRPKLELPVLRALFRTYLEMQEFDRIRLKLFVRKDLFRRIIEGGFVNLTHVNARKIEIAWSHADLFSLLHKRLIENPDFVGSLGLPADVAPDELFATVFPEKVDPGKRKPTTWTWILGRIRDGNNVKPPRNLIDLILKSREVQLRSEDRVPREYSDGTTVIDSEALKGGLDSLSRQRVEDTLLAEAGDYATLIEKFRGGKSEHNLTTLQKLLGLDANNIKYLQLIGFLEPVGSNYKVPMLYRGGLDITQGKAFPAGDGETDSDELE